jgi:putative peptidoglycan lipid II flippase
LRLVFLLALPAAIGLGMTAEGIVSVLFQGQEFTAFDVRQTALAVVGYSVGLLGLIAVKILAPGFYAQKDIRTPVKIAIAVLIATQLANLVLVPIFAHAGLALSVGLGACANALALFVGLRRRKLYQPAAGWISFVARLALALAVLAVILWWAQRPLAWSGMQDVPWQRVAWLASVIGAATVGYFAALFALGFRMRDFGVRRA